MYHVAMLHGPPSAPCATPGGCRGRSGYWVRRGREGGHGLRPEAARTSRASRAPSLRRLPFPKVPAPGRTGEQRVEGGGWRAQGAWRSAAPQLSLLKDPSPALPIGLDLCCNRVRLADTPRLVLQL